MTGYERNEVITMPNNKPNNLAARFWGWVEQRTAAQVITWLVAVGFLVWIWMATAPKGVTE